MRRKMNGRAGVTRITTTNTWSLSYAVRAILKAPRFLLCLARANNVELDSVKANPAYRWSVSRKET